MITQLPTGCVRVGRYCQGEQSLPPKTASRSYGLTKSLNAQLPIQTRFFALSSPFELAQPAPSAPSSHGAMVSVDSSTRATGPDAVAIGRKINVVKMRRVQAIGNGQPVIGNGPRTLSGKRPTAAALRLERLDWSAVPPSRDDVVRD